MVLSIEKTKTLFISNREKSVQINTNCNSANVKIGNTIIDKVNSTKLLGVNVDNTLSWTMQVAQVKKWLPFNEIVKFRQVGLVYKAVNGNAPQYIQTMFTNIKDHSNFFT